MDPEIVRHTVAQAADRGLTIEEALNHWQMAGAADAGKQSAHWVSIAFGLARKRREGNGPSDPGHSPTRA